MGSLAVITARGGSKRIPKKNIKLFCGKPIIAYSIKAALNSKLFDEVMVSTDSEEIASVAKQYGASVPFMRSEQNSNDYATTAEVLLEVVQEYKRIGQEYEHICCVYPTAPFVTSEKLRTAFEQLTTADAVIPVVKYSFPPQRAFILRNGKLCFQYPECERIRSQDLEPIYHDCGQFYVIKTEALLQYHSLLVPNTVPFITSDEEVQDIDTISDWKIAEVKYKLAPPHE